MAPIASRARRARQEARHNRTNDRCAGGSRGDAKASFGLPQADLTSTAAWKMRGSQNAAIRDTYVPERTTQCPSGALVVPSVGPICSPFVRLPTDARNTEKPDLAYT